MKQLASAKYLSNYLGETRKVIGLSTGLWSDTVICPPSGPRAFATKSVRLRLVESEAKGATESWMAGPNYADKYRQFVE